MSDVTIRKVADPGKTPYSLFAETRCILDGVRNKAFDLFCERGCIHGRALDDWLEAERRTLWSPTSELIETNTQFELQVAAPGLEIEDIAVNVSPDSITVLGETAHFHEKTEGKIHFSEFTNKPLFRRFTLPAPIDVQNTVATLEKGILKVNAQKGAVRGKGDPIGV